MTKTDLSIIMQHHMGNTILSCYEQMGYTFDEFLEDLLPIAKEIYKETRRKTTRHEW